MLTAVEAGHAVTGLHPASDTQMSAFADRVGLSLCRFTEVTDTSQAIAAAQLLGWPVAMKLGLLGLTHKSDHGGVLLGVADEKGVEEAFEKLAELSQRIQPDAPVVIKVEEMVPPGIELIISSRLDELFGRVVMIGLGGIFVEYLDDIAFRLAPCSPREAEVAIQELTGARLLQGVRGLAPVDVGRVAEVVSQLSMAFDDGDGMRAVEFNPVIVTSKGLTAVDWNGLTSDSEMES
jgi:succinyl-CoA synthetase beta subunit